MLTARRCNRMQPSEYPELSSHFSAATVQIFVELLAVKCVALPSVDAYRGLQQTAAWGIGEFIKTMNDAGPLLSTSEARRLWAMGPNLLASLWPPSPHQRTSGHSL
eukprot:6077544-Alexandrium_andersonii.AAC.1